MSRHMYATSLPLAGLWSSVSYIIGNRQKVRMAIDIGTTQLANSESQFTGLSNSKQQAVIAL